MAVSRSLTEWKVPRRFAWRVMIPKKIHHVQPAAAGRGEVQLDSEVPGQPGLDVGVLVGGVVVADHVQGDPGVGAGDSLEERQEPENPPTSSVPAHPLTRCLTPRLGLHGCNGRASVTGTNKLLRSSPTRYRECLSGPSSRPPTI
jgi:hypothetical protein